MDIAVWIAFRDRNHHRREHHIYPAEKTSHGRTGKVAAMTEDILAGRRLRTSAPGDELLLARIENQLVRIQEMLDGRRKEAEKSRDEIQKLISEIAHQMRTPLTNIESYTGFLKDMAERLSRSRKKENRKGLLRSVCSIYLLWTESERKLHFLVDSFVKMARLEQHIIQIRKNEKDLLKTIRIPLGRFRTGRRENRSVSHCHAETGGLRP